MKVSLDANLTFVSAVAGAICIFMTLWARPSLVFQNCQGEMYNKVKVDDSFWTLEDGKEVSIALQKVHK